MTRRGPALGDAMSCCSGSTLSDTPFVFWIMQGCPLLIPGHIPRPLQMTPTLLWRRFRGASQTRLSLLLATPWDLSSSQSIWQRRTLESG